MGFKQKFFVLDLMLSDKKLKREIDEFKPPTLSLLYLRIHLGFSSYYLQSSQIPRIKLCKSFFANLSFLRRLVLKFCDFSNITGDEFTKCLNNLQLLDISHPKNCSHIHLTHLSSLKWLRLKVYDKDLPSFQHANSDLEVFKFTQFNRRTSSSKELIQTMCFPRLKAFSFKNNLDEFDLEWISEHYEMNSLRLSEVKSLKGSFSNFSNLRSLELNDIVNFGIHPGVFQGLKNLKSLIISHNRYINSKLSDKKQLKNGVFDGLDQLEKLKLHNNRIHTIEKDVFRNLSNLVSLDLSFNHLTQIDPDLFNQTLNLIELNLRGNTGIKIFKGTFNRLARLEYLNLQKCSIELVEDQGFRTLSSLKELDLSENRSLEIECFESMFNGLVNLKKLNVQSVAIVSSPLDFFMKIKCLEKVVVDETWYVYLDELKMKCPNIDFEIRQRLLVY